MPAKKRSTPAKKAAKPPTDAELRAVLGKAGAVWSAIVRAVEEKFPTSAIAVLSFEGSWRDLEPGTANLDEFAVAR